MNISDKLTRALDKAVQDKADTLLEEKICKLRMGSADSTANNIKGTVDKLTRANLDHSRCNIPQSVACKLLVDKIQDLAVAMVDKADEVKKRSSHPLFKGQKEIDGIEGLNTEIKNLQDESDELLVVFDNIPRLPTV